MGIKDKAKGVAGRLKLDSHHAIERFGVVASGLAVAFVLLFGGAMRSASANNKEQLDSTALYTPTFTTSKTELSGVVNGVYRSNDGRRAMVLMQFKEAESRQFSADANTYQGFLTGSDSSFNHQALKSDVEGDIVMFGSTGYMGVVLDSDVPFEQQILNLTLRAKSELVYNEGTGKLRKDLEGVDSFKQHDQWRVFVNPGASQAEKADSLDGGRIDVAAIYYELVIAPQEAEVRAQMNERLAMMSAGLVRIEEYTAEMNRVNVDGVSIVPPKVPEQIAGDVVTGVRGNDMPVTESADGDTSAMAPSTTAVGEKVVKSTLDLSTKWVSPKGYDFDWRGGSVEEGYLKDLVPKGGSYIEYLNERSLDAVDETDDGEAAAKDGFRPNELEWVLNDKGGTNLKTDYGSSDALTMKPLKDIMNNLTQAYTDYYTDKKEYQEALYGQLLELEVQLRNVESTSSVNNGDAAVVIW